MDQQELPDHQDQDQALLQEDPVAPALDDPQLMRQALMCLGLAPIAAQEFINNGITTPEELRLMTSKHLFRLIKQIHRDNINGIFIPFKSQQYVEPIMHWANRQHIIGARYHPDHITRPVAIEWIRRMKEEQVEKDARATITSLVKAPESLENMIILDQMMYSTLPMKN